MSETATISAPDASEARTVEDSPQEPLPSDRAPRVTVGMPVYNGEAYVERALDSLLAQDFEDFELIVSDNGSTDATETIVRRYAERDPRIRYQRTEENRGAAWNFSHLVDMARGEYFRWACHDDTCEPTHLRRCVEMLDASPPSVILAYTRTVIIDERDVGVWTEDENLDTRGESPHERLKHLALSLRYSNVLYGLLRTDALRQTSRLAPYESSDYVLLVELALLGEFAEVPAYLFRRRVHDRMSRRANTTRTSVAQWFSPAARGTLLPHGRLMWEYSKAVLDAPLSPMERGRSMLALSAWARRSARPFLREAFALLSPTLSGSH